jgi:predicted RNA-binding Zn ribbon-like protein
MSVTIRASSLVMTMLMGWITFSTAAKAASEVESERVSKILSDAKMQAFQLKEDAEQLETFSRATGSWASHVEAINKIKENVNIMGRLLAKLQENRNSAALWQRTAIDRVTPIAKELAANTTTAIEHLSKTPDRLTTPTYQNYLEAIADSASNLASTIAEFVDYGKTKQRLDRLVRVLEIPAGS